MPTARQPAPEAPAPNGPLSDRTAAALRGFGPLGLLAVVVILVSGTPLLGGPLVLLWAYLSRTPWSEIGLGRPVRWATTIVGGIVFGVAFKLVMKAVVMPLLGADPINHTYHYLAANRAAIPRTLFAVVFGAGFGEEMVFRGFGFERLRKLLGRSAAATVAIVLFTSALFAAAHYSDQGLPGVQQAAFTGLVFGTIYGITGRIWMVMVAHAAFDIAAVAIIYWNLESTVAHLLIR
jgi:membrane protease YdiL (CAAX protease family)